MLSQRRQTHHELASHLKCSRVAVTNLLGGRYELTLSRLLQLSHFFDMNPGRLVNELVLDRDGRLRR